MSLIQKIKNAQLQYRKERKTTYAGYLTALIGEVEAVGKKELREPTDSEVIAMLKKFLKGVDENLALATRAGNEQRATELALEEIIYEQFLPKQLTEADLRLTIDEILEVRPDAKMGDLMKHFKGLYDGQYDGALLSRLIKERLQ